MTFKPFQGDVPFQQSSPKMFRPQRPAAEGGSGELDDLFATDSRQDENLPTPETVMPHHAADIAEQNASSRLEPFSVTKTSQTVELDNVHASHQTTAIEQTATSPADMLPADTLPAGTLPPPPKTNGPQRPDPNANLKAPAESSTTEVQTHTGTQRDDKGTAVPADNTQTDTATVDDQTGGGRLASRRALQEVVVAQLGNLPANHAVSDRRTADLERLYSTIDKITAIVAADPELNNLASSFQLTKDRELDSRQRRELETRVSPKLLEHNVYIDSARDGSIIYDMLYDELLGISVLGGLWRDDTIADICIDAWDKITVERNGRLVRTDVRFRSHDHAVGVVRALSRKMSDRQVSPTNPLVTATLPSARVQFVYGELSASGIAVVIRKFKPLLGMEGLLAVDALDRDMADFLAACVRARATILVSGGTGTGKTTMINALSEFIPDDERVVSIEDAFELQLSNSSWVPLQSKQRASADDTNITTQADLMVATLRMRPDRIIVGEIREADAAAVMFDAANTGHDGTMTTIHAETAASAVNNRLTVMLMRSDGGFSEDIARLTVAQTIHLVVQITRKHGRRYVSEIAVVDEHYIDERRLIAPKVIYRTSLDIEQRQDGPVAQLRHEHVSRVEATTTLAAKLVDAGEDAGRWTTN
jgi:pilus assembly protein CpaF